MMKNFTKLACFLALICSNNLFATTFYVSNNSGGGAGSLNQAVTDANADATATAGTPHKIEFCVSGVINASPNYGNWMVLNGPKDMSLKIVGSNSIQNSGLATKFVKFNNLVFTGVNGSSFGGAIMFGVNATFYYNNCRFTNCSAFDHGGALFINGGTINFNGCTFDNNQTTSPTGWAGGAVHNNGGTCSFTNCTFYNNHTGSNANTGANGAGGGALMNNAGGTMNIVNCTFFANSSANQGGAVHNRQGATCNISNSIFVGNTADTSGQDLSGIFNSSFGHNIIGSNTGGFSLTGYTSGNIAGVLASGIVNTTFGNYGYPIPTIEIPNTSLAVDAGNAAGTPPTKDQKGRGRNGIIDIGAVEYNGTNPCSLTADLGPTTTYLSGLPSNIHTTHSGGSGPLTMRFSFNGNTTCGVDTFVANAYGMLKFVISDTLGCVATDSTLLAAVTPASALNFDGSNDLVTIAAINLASQSFSLECWAKRNTTGVGQLFVSQGNIGSSQGLQFGYVNDTYFFGFYNDDLWVNGLAAATDLNWHHYAATYDAVTKKQTFYVDGKPVGSRIATADYIGTGTLLLGDSPWGGSALNGNLDELRIWDHVLCEGEINANRHGELHGSVPGLIANYHFNQGSIGLSNSAINTVVDSSGNGHNGIMNNFDYNSGVSDWTGPSPVTSNVVPAPLAGIGVHNSNDSLEIAFADASPALSDNTDYGNVATGSTVANYFTLHNLGNVALNISGVTISGPNASDFFVSAQAPATMAICNAAQFSVAFNPSTVGVKNATVNIPSNDPNHPNYTFAITGNAVTPPERALAFDGVNDYLSTPHDTSLHLNQFTIESYIKTSSTAFQNIIMKGSYGYGLAVDNGQIEYWDQYSGGQGPNSTAGSVPLNQWTHIAVTHDGTNISFYINGVLNSTSPSTIINNYGGDLTLGIQGTTCACNYFQGAMDEVRVWNTVRTQAEIQANKDCDVAQQTGLVAYYRFNQGVANGTNTGLGYALDFSGNGHCAVANNFALSGTTSNWTNGAIGTCNTIVPSANPSVNIATSGATVFCVGDSVTLYASGANTYSWSTGSTSDSITVTTSGTYTLIGHTPCGSDTATMVITVNPLPTVSAGADQTVCSGSNVTLTGSGATTYVWNNGVTDGVSFVLGSTTTYAVTGSDANGCSNTDTVKVNVDALPTSANAGTDQVWCSATTANLNANTPITGIGTWSLIGGGVATISNPSSPTSSVTGLADNTSYTIRWTIANGTCSDVDDMVISNYAMPTTADAGSDTTICTYNVFNLNANIPSSGVGVWSIISGPGVLALADSSLNNTAVYNLLQNTAAVLRWTVSTNPVCSDSFDDITVTGMPAPIINAGVDQTICPEGYANLSGSLTNTSGPNWTTGGSGTFSPSPNSLNVQYTPSPADISAGSVILYLNVMGCGAGFSDDLLLSFVPNGISYAHISGNVSSLGSPVTAGLITLFEKLPNGSINVNPTDTLSITNGTYAFDSIPAGKYTLYYRCGAACNYTVRPTYLGNVAQYQLSDSLTIGCQDTLANIDMSALQVVQAPTGSGTISGRIIEGGVFKNMQQGDPIPGVDVALEQNPGSVMMSYGQTDASGNFTFTNLAFGNYVIVADIPGYGLDTSVVQVISSTTPSRSVVLCSDTTLTEIGVCASVTGVENVEATTVSIAPNPSNGVYVLTTNIISDVVIYNGLGQLVKTFKATEGRNTFSLENEANGIYLVQIKNTKGVTSSKIVKE